jgi:hypothetical protein
VSAILGLPEGDGVGAGLNLGVVEGAPWKIREGSASMTVAV